ncbi:hypothetical protein [Spirosoma jeollabukense]
MSYYEQEGRTYMKPDFFYECQEKGLIIDASKGGLVQGAGEIMVVSPTEKGEFIMSSPVIPFQFLVNAYADEAYKADINARNLPWPQSFMLFRPYAVPKGITVIDASPKEVDGVITTPFIFFDTNFARFLGPNVARGHLAWLEKINQDAWNKSDRLLSLKPYAYLPRFDN